MYNRIIMLKVRKQKIIKQTPQQRQALKYLNFISDKETGYLQDWSKINEIKEQDFQSSHEYIQSVGVPQIQRANLDNNIGAASTERRQTNTNSPSEKINLADREKKMMEVKVQNFATIPQRKSLLKIRKSELNLYKRMECQQQAQSHHTQNQHNEGSQRYRAQNRQRQSASMNYMDKIRQLSLPWIKHFPREQKNEILHNQQEMKLRQQTRRLNDLIKNKIRRKQTNKFILQKQKIQEEENEQKSNKNATDASANKLSWNVEEGIDSNQMKILKNWLDYNRSKRKRSITSLLNEHFQFKYLEKKKQRQRAMALKSLKIISSQPSPHHQ